MISDWTFVGSGSDMVVSLCSGGFVCVLPLVFFAECSDLRPQLEFCCLYLHRANRTLRRPLEKVEISSIAELLDGRIEAEV